MFIHPVLSLHKRLTCSQAVWVPKISCGWCGWVKAVSGLLGGSELCFVVLQQRCRCFGGSCWGITFFPEVGLGSVEPAGADASADQKVGGSWWCCWHGSRSGFSVVDICTKVTEFHVLLFSSCSFMFPVAGGLGPPQGTYQLHILSTKFFTLFR